MNNNIVKLAFGLSVVGMLVILAGMAVVTVVMFSIPVETQNPMVELRPGMVVKGTGDEIFYLTPEQTRRCVGDKATLAAFGFTLADVVEVDETVLANIPLAGDLTRLVQFEQGNLYWVMDGQRWLVNEWQPVVNRAGYVDMQPTPLDDWLQHNLPVRLNFEPGMLLKNEGGRVYAYDFNSNTMTPVDQAEYTQARIIRVPAGVLAVYPRPHAPQSIARYLVTANPAVDGLK
jgi:hypothetical protein